MTVLKLTVLKLTVLKLPVLKLPVLKLPVLKSTLESVWHNFISGILAALLPGKELND